MPDLLAKIESASVILVCMEREVRERFEAIDLRLNRTAELLSGAAETVGHLASGSEKSEARMTRIEENLKTLIEAITRKHANGRSRK